MKIILCHTSFQILSPKSYLNLLIRLISGSKFDHAIILNNDLIEESIFKGVRNIHIERYLHDTKKRKRKHFEVLTSKKFDEDFLKRALGAEYDFTIYFRIPLFLISKKIFGRQSKITKLLSLYSNDNAWYCFELAAEALGLEDSHLISGEDFDKIFKIEPIDELK